jgi:hypothetical protein
MAGAVGWPPHILAHDTGPTFYESGLSINVMYNIDDPEKWAAAFKLSEGMEVATEVASRFKFARQKSKLAGTIRGSYFAFKNEH